MSKKVYSYKQAKPPKPKKTGVEKKQFLKYVSSALILLGIVFLGLAYGPIIYDEVWYQYSQLRGQRFLLDINDGSKPTESPFGKFLMAGNVVRVRPVNTDFSLVIEKIGVNVPVVKDVSVTDSDAYLEALKSGVAHASNSYYPSSDPGNVYMFAHASVNFWQLGRYATVFNLLRKLELGDEVHVFYDQKQFTYEVMNKEVLNGFEVYPIVRPTIEPTLTLQTCDPPGTTLNRLVVTAKLKEVIDLE